MYFESVVASDISKLETARAERRAAELWRYRHARTKTDKAIVAVITSLVSLFVR
jgi:hypothetical protein